MKYLKGGFYGLIALNIIILLGMLGQTFIYWDNRFTLVYEWSSQVRALYVFYTICFVIAGMIANREGE